MKTYAKLIINYSLCDLLHRCSSSIHYSLAGQLKYFEQFRHDLTFIVDNFFVLPVDPCPDKILILPKFFTGYGTLCLTIELILNPLI